MGGTQYHWQDIFFSSKSNDFAIIDKKLTISVIKEVVITGANSCLHPLISTTDGAS